MRLLYKTLHHLIAQLATMSGNGMKVFIWRNTGSVNYVIIRTSLNNHLLRNHLNAPDLILIILMGKRIASNDDRVFTFSVDDVKIIRLLNLLHKLRLMRRQYEEC